MYFLKEKKIPPLYIRRPTQLYVCVCVCACCSVWREGESESEISNKLVKKLVLQLTIIYGHLICNTRDSFFFEIIFLLI